MSFTPLDLRTALMTIADSVNTTGNPPYRNSAICANVFFLSDVHDPTEVFNMVGHYAKSWPHFSGDPKYPIPVDNESFIYYVSIQSLWTDKQGEYRMSLIQHIIEQIQSELNGFPQEESI